MRSSEAIAAAVADIRAVDVVDRASIAKVKERLLELASERDLFPASDYPADGDRSSTLYRLSQDADDTNALYLNVCRNVTDTPPHDHTTWAVVVGLDGEEENRFYERTADGVEQIGASVVKDGTGVAMLGDDVHSIHITGGALNFHMYGVALEQLHERRFFRASDATWQVFPAHTDIRDARE